VLTQMWLGLAAQNVGCAIQFADERCWTEKQRRDILLDAVESDGTAVRYRPQFKDDTLVIVLAMLDTHLGFQHASSRLKNNWGFVCWALRRHPHHARCLLRQMSLSVLKRVVQCRDPDGFDSLIRFEAACASRDKKTMPPSLGQLRCPRCLGKRPGLKRCRPNLCLSLSLRSTRAWRVSSL
jgi:hypothetical protein